MLSNTHAVCGGSHTVQLQPVKKNRHFCCNGRHENVRSEHVLKMVVDSAVALFLHRPIEMHSSHRAQSCVVCLRAKRIMVRDQLLTNLQYTCCSRAQDAVSYVVWIRAVGHSTKADRRRVYCRLDASQARFWMLAVRFWRRGSWRSPTWLEKDIVD